MGMTRDRGTPFPVPDWWLEALRRLTADRSGADLAAALSKIARRNPPWRRESVNLFRSGEVTTLEMMNAFIALLDGELPSPLVIARSFEEAHRLGRLAQTYDEDVPVLERTEENYDAPETEKISTEDRETEGSREKQDKRHGRASK